MNCWFGYKTRKDLFDRLDKQIEISNGYPSIKKILKTVNTDWAEAIAKNVKKIAVEPSLDLEEVPTLEAVYSMIGKNAVRLGRLEQIAMDLLSPIYGRRIRCKEVEKLIINCKKQTSLMMEMSFAIIKEGEKNESNEEGDKDEPECSGSKE